MRISKYGLEAWACSMYQPLRADIQPLVCDPSERPPKPNPDTPHPSPSGRGFLTSPPRPLGTSVAPSTTSPARHPGSVAVGRPSSPAAARESTEVQAPCSRGSAGSAEVWPRRSPCPEEKRDVEGVSESEGRGLEGRLWLCTCRAYIVPTLVLNK